MRVIYSKPTNTVTIIINLLAGISNDIVINGGA